MALREIRTTRLAYRLFALAALCVITISVYSNSLHGTFTLDNRGLLLEDPRLREASPGNIRLITGHTYWWPQGESGLYRPVTTLSYLFNYSVLGNREQPEAYHWLNLFLHCGNVLLVYALALALWGEFWPSFFTAALWAVHPVLTESVSNIVGRADLLAAMCVLGGLLLYRRFAESPGLARWAWLAALAAVSAIGMFSKESAAVLPGVIVLYEFAGWRRTGGDKPGRLRSLLVACGATLIPLAAFLYQRSLVLAVSAPAAFPFTDNPLVVADFWAGRLTALKVLGLYLGLLAWPVHLSCDYSFAQIPLARGSWQDWLAWTAAAAVVAGAVVLYRRRVHRRQAGAFFLLAFAFAALLPVSNLLFPIGTIMAERFLYLPAVALAGCLAAGVYALMRRLGRERLAALALGVITVLLAARTYARNLDWRDDLTLARSAVGASPDSYKAHKMMAQALFAADFTHANIDQVIAEMDRSVAIIDQVADFRNDALEYRQAAGFNLMKGDVVARRQSAGSTPPPEAQEAYRKALLYGLRYMSIVQAIGAAGRTEDAQELLATAYLRTGDPGKAYEQAVAARGMTPLKPAVYHLMADALLAAGREGEAAVTMVEGSILTSDPEFRARLIELYRNGLDTEGCALAVGPQGPAVNPQCSIVRRHICQAAQHALRTLSSAGKQNIARDLRESFIRDSGCSAADLSEGR